MLASMLFSRVGSNSSSSDSLAVASSSVRSSEGLGLQEPLFQVGAASQALEGDTAYKATLEAWSWRASSETYVLGQLLLTASISGAS
jgi:hypothetical protein